MEAISNKLDWSGVVQNIAEDKKRIEAYLKNPKAGIPDGIKFVKPRSLRTAGNK